MTLPANAPENVISAEGLNTSVVCFPTISQYYDLVAAFKADGYEMIVDLCGVDYLEHANRSVPEGIVATRFEVVVNLLSLSKKTRARIRLQAGTEHPSVPSLFDLYPGTEALERETFDMFGILFENHPDLTRILMPEDWEGHPLRKDFSVGRVPVQFKETPAPR